MHTSTRLLVSALLLCSSLAFAQVEVVLGIPLPRVTFEVEPALVVIAPGVQVVPEYEEEVFFVDRHYWVHQQGRWYRSRDCHGHWAPVKHRHVPARLVELPRGRYRHYRSEHHRAEHHHEHGRKDHPRHGKSRHSEKHRHHDHH